MGAFQSFIQSLPEASFAGPVAGVVSTCIALVLILALAGLWPLLRKLLSGVASFVGWSDRLLSQGLSRIAGSRLRYRHQRWPTLFVMLFGIPFLIGSFATLLGSLISIALYVLISLMALAVYRHWSWDIEDRAKGLYGNYKRIPGWAELHLEWLAAILSLFLVLPLLLFEINALLSGGVSGPVEPLGVVAYFWGEVLKGILLFDYWEVFAHRLLDPATDAYRTAFESVGAQAPEPLRPTTFFGEWITFGLRVGVDLILLGGLIQFIRFLGGDLEKAKVDAAGREAVLGDNNARERAVRILEGFAVADRSPAKRRLSEIARTANAPGVLFTVARALSAIGRRLGDEAALLDAISAYREALRSWTRERAPRNWAMIHSNLGISLTYLGRMRGEESLLEGAINAYREALDEWTHEHDPHYWALTQNNLGYALAELGRMREDESLLEEALKAIREALTEWTREHAPLDWALTKNNLGTVLADLGRMLEDESLFVGAISAHREALNEFTRERVPLEWAMTQNNIGASLADLGRLRGDESLLRGAIVAYRNALKERTRERVPIRWAMTQSNLGTVLADLGRLRGDESLFVDAINAYREALKERARERFPLYWAASMLSLSQAQGELGARRSDALMLERARAAATEVLAFAQATNRQDIEKQAHKILARIDEAIARIAAGEEAATPVFTAEAVRSFSALTMQPIRDTSGIAVEDTGLIFERSRIVREIS